MTLNNLQTLITILRTQSNGSVDFDLAKLDLLVAIALNPGRTGQEYGKMIDTPESTVNRHLRELRDVTTGRTRPKQGLGLVTGEPDPNDWRKITVQLSRKGKLLIEQVLALGS